MISIRSGFDPDKIIAQDQARQAEERKAAEAAARQKEIGERRGRKKGTPVAPATPSAPSVAPYKGIQFEPFAYRADENGERKTEKELFTYDQSLAGLQVGGFDRHPLPFEVFSLLADNLENKLTDPGLKAVAEDMLKSHGEWLDMAMERKGDILQVYFGVSGLRWDGKKYVRDNFLADQAQQFNIKGIPSSQYVDLVQFPDQFTQAVYGRTFAALPTDMRSGNRQAQVYLPNDGIIRPVGLGVFLGRFDAVAAFKIEASRGVRQAPQGAR